MFDIIPQWLDCIEIFMIKVDHALPTRLLIGGTGSRVRGVNSSLLKQTLPIRPEMDELNE